MKKIAILVLLTLLLGCESSVTIGDPKPYEPIDPQRPVRQDYVVLVPGWEKTVDLNNYVLKTDSVLAEMKFRIDSLEYILFKQTKN